MKIIHKNKGVIAYLQPDPWTEGATIVTTEETTEASGNILEDVEKSLPLFLEAQKVAHLLCDKLSVQRCALVSYPSGNNRQIQVLPLHGLEKNWEPYEAEIEEYNSTDPGKIFCI